MRKSLFGAALCSSFLLACGGGGASAPDTQHGGSAAASTQSLPDAVCLVCDAPVRTNDDPSANDAAVRDAKLHQHLRDQLTNAEVLAIVEGWDDPQKSHDERLAEVRNLAMRAGLSTPCPLADLWGEDDE